MTPNEIEAGLREWAAEWKRDADVTLVTNPAEWHKAVGPYRLLIEAADHIAATQPPTTGGSPRCSCGQPDDASLVHRYGNPCFVRDPELCASEQPPATGWRDDGEPVTEEWLRSVADDSRDLDFRFGKLGQTIWIECRGTALSLPERRWYFGNHPMPTRGHVRRLLAALGISPLSDPSATGGSGSAG
jgi:hypothetical protein